MTLPVANVDNGAPWQATAQIIGFVQVFLNDNGQAAPNLSGGINGVITNLAGCGTAATGTQVVGNGPSAVAVRLIRPAS